MARRVAPRKRFGQHFLEPAWVRKLIDAIDPQPEDRFLEIGPGGGALTRPLAERSRAVTAIEIDRDLAADLRRRAPPNVTVVQGDVLDIDLAGLVSRESRTRIAGNLPYNIASPILFTLTRLYRGGAPLHDATLMLQLEVAERLAAGPGTRPYGVLAILVGLHADVDRVLTLPPGAFRPPPQVRSAVVRLRFRPPPIPLADEAAFEALVKSIFTQRRKTLANALKPFAAARGRQAGPALARAGVEGGRRPETLTLPELARVVEALTGGSSARSA